MVDITWFPRIGQWRVFVFDETTGAIVAASETRYAEDDAVKDAAKLQEKYGGEIKRSTVNAED